jgi:hypothetical protein
VLASDFVAAYPTTVAATQVLQRELPIHQVDGAMFSRNSVIMDED